MKTRYIITIAICIFLATLSVTSGASLLLQTDNAQRSGADTSTVTVQLDPEDETLNAIEGTVSYPPNLLSLERIQTGGSIISLWVEEPTRTEPGTVQFSGVMVSGFDGVLSSQYDGARPGELMRLHFTHTSDQSAVVTFEEITGYLHDGKGTQIAMDTASAILNYASDYETMKLSGTTEESQDEANKAEQDARTDDDQPSEKTTLDSSVETSRKEAETSEDTTQSTSTQEGDNFSGRDDVPPSQLSADIVKSEYLYDGRYALAFNARDAASGIAYYEVKESPQSYSIESLYQRSSWRKAESPALLADQRLESNISVKAVDKAGNERIATIPAQNSVPWYKNYIILSLLLLVLVVVGRFFFAHSSRESM